MQLRGITCHEQAGFGPKRVTSCADGVGKAILMALEDGQSEEPAVTIEQEDKPMHYGSCPQCGSATIREGGCVVCKACGWDKCS
jgi:ribonucleoside-diphosphate reductase alpha chain